MSSPLIPRDLIKHLEWAPDKKASPQPPQENPTTTPILSPSGRPDLSDYIRVSMNGIYGKPVFISAFELPGYNNKQYNPTHVKLLRNGLYMPTPEIFTRHVTNVHAAKRGELTLFHADGRVVPDSLVDEMHKHLSTNFKDVYSAGQSGAWTWLNAKYVHGLGHNGLNVETVNGIERTDTKKVRLIKSTRPLEECLWEYGVLVDFEFNAQGLALPSSKSSSEKYVKGKNLFFYHPVNGSVARFGAYSSWAGLYCDRGPQDTYDALGVFGCAEGAVAKSGGSAS